MSVAAGSGPRRVLYVAYDLFSLGGIQRYSRYEVRALRELLPDADIRICSLRGPEAGGFPPPEQVEIVGGRSRRARAAFVARVLRLARAQKPDLVVCDHVNLAALGWGAARIAGAPYCVNVYGIEVWWRLLPWRWAPFVRADRVASGCDFTRQVVDHRHPRLRGRTRVVHDCVDVARFTPGPAEDRLAVELGLPPGPVVLTVSRLARGRSKGHDRVLEAMAGPLVDVPFTYLVVGDGSDRARLEARARELGVEDRVRFVGSVPDDDLPGFYRLCDVFVLVSAFRLGRRREGEGIPLVVLEAQASGKPVVTSRLDGSAESISDGRTGFLVDPGDPSEVASSLRRLVTDPTLCEQMGAEARAFVEERFSFGRFCERLAAALPGFAADPAARAVPASELSPPE